MIAFLAFKALAIQSSKALPDVDQRSWSNFFWRILAVSFLENKNVSRTPRVHSGFNVTSKQISDVNSGATQRVPQTVTSVVI
jgi:hypothetical protein